MRGAVLYLRVSTLDQVQNLSLSTQRERCEDFCRREGFEVLGVFEERGESAKTANRSEFQRAVAWCQKHRRDVDLFLVYSFDRFCRSTLDHATYRARLATMGIALRAVSQPVDDSPTGEFVETLLAAQAQLDNRLRASRTVDGMQAAQRRGRWTHKAPLGYLNGGRGHPSLVPDPERGPFVASAFERMAAGTATQRDVVRSLRAEGLRTRAGNPVSLQTFRRMIGSPIYCGRLVTAWGEFQGDWEPLISEDLFDQVQLVLQGRRPSVLSKPHQHPRPEFPLQGFSRCDACGTQLTAEAKKGGRFRYYRCWNRDCSVGTIAARKLEDAFAALLDTLRPRPEYIRLFREMVLRADRKRHDAKGSERARLEARRDDLQRQKRNLGRELARGTLDSNSYQELREEIDAELAEVRVELSEAAVQEVDVEGVLNFAEELFLDPAKMWRQLPPDKKRLLQSSLFPEGVAWRDGELRTPVTASFVAALRAPQAADTRMASPTGLEPVLPP